MYDAVAIAFILVAAGLLWLTFKWASASGRLGRVGMLRLTIGVFSVIFERLFERLAIPFQKRLSI